MLLCWREGRMERASHFKRSNSGNMKFNLFLYVLFFVLLCVFYIPTNNQVWTISRSYHIGALMEIALKNSWFYSSLSMVGFWWHGQTCAWLEIVFWDGSSTVVKNLIWSPGNVSAWFYGKITKRLQNVFYHLSFWSYNPVIQLSNQSKLGWRSGHEGCGLDWVLRDGPTTWGPAGQAPLPLAAVLHLMDSSSCWNHECVVPLVIGALLYESGFIPCL